MHQDAEISISKYARICSTKYAENMHHMHKWNMQNICPSAAPHASVYKNMQIKNMHYMQISICIYMQNICRNMQNQICISKICVSKICLTCKIYVLICIVCQNMHKHKYVDICIKICTNKQKICKYMQIYAFAPWVYLNYIYILYIYIYICKNMQKICMYMQNMWAWNLYA